MWKAMCVVIPLFAMSLPATAEIFKCQKAGKEVYQNFPCPIDSIGSQATAAPPKETTASAPHAGDSAAVVNSGTQGQPQGGGIAGNAPIVKNADGKYEPRVGMTRRQVRRLSWGEPDEIVRTDEGEFVWTYPDKRQLRFDSNGRLTSVQR